MIKLTPTGDQRVAELAARYQISTDAVRHLLLSLAQGNGTMAQFNHPELGGNGQWMAGGMLMIGDMFNNQLKATVSGICDALASDWPALIEVSATGSVSGGWWPAELGAPAMSGAQNQIRYAYFPQHRRLVLEHSGQLAQYDTGQYQLSGVSQQQGGQSSLSFSSPQGNVTVEQLSPVGSPGQSPSSSAASSAPTPASPTPTSAPTTASSAPSGGSDDIFAKLERLADLKQKGILSDQEFEAKKAELLSRI